MTLRSLAAAHGKALCSFGAMQAMQIILPLLALPWLARILGPKAFGILMYLSLLPPLTSLFMDWGLALGGARSAAKLRGKDEELGKLLGAALSGKLILAFCCVVFFLVATPFLPYGPEYPLAYALAVAAGIARGMNPAWFFQGAGFGLPRMAAYDVAASATALLLVFLFIHEPSDWPRFLFFIALCKGCAYGWLIFGLARQYKARLNFKQGLNILRQTAPFFGAAFSLMFCYNGGQLVLGYFLSAADMGIISAVMKMLRALASLVMPFTQTLFPEICILRELDPAKARRVLRLSLIFTFLGSCAAWIAASVLAPWLIAIALGKEYQAAAHVLRIMLLAAPFMACNNVLSFQILAPFGQEKAQLAVQACCAVISIPLAAALGYLYGLTGGAMLPVCCEIIMSIGFVAAIIKNNIK